MLFVTELLRPVTEEQCYPAQRGSIGFRTFPSVAISYYDRRSRTPPRPGSSVTWRRSVAARRPPALRATLSAQWLFLEAECSHGIRELAGRKTNLDTMFNDWQPDNFSDRVRIHTVFFSAAALQRHAFETAKIGPRVATHWSPQQRRTWVDDARFECNCKSSLRAATEHGVSIDSAVVTIRTDNGAGWPFSPSFYSPTFLVEELDEVVVISGQYGVVGSLLVTLQDAGDWPP